MKKLLLLASLVGAPMALAQAPAAGEAAAPAAAQAEDALVKATRLPEVAHRLRKQGVSDDDVKAAVKAAKDKGLKAGEADEALEAAEEGVKAHGPVDNFGAFVQTQLDAGLRGKELADAIHKEHEARGKGKPEGKGPDGEKGKPDDKGKPELKDGGEKGKPDDKGKDAPVSGHGKPDDKGGKPPGPQGKQGGQGGGQGGAKQGGGQGGGQGGAKQGGGQGGQPGTAKKK